MKNILIAGMLVFAWTPHALAELVENGGFSKKMSCWQIDVSELYGGTKPVFNLEDGVLEARGLHPTSAGYLTFMQAVNIRKGVKYKLKYEMRGEGEGDFLVSIMHAGIAVHFGSPATPGTSWKTVEVEFVGQYDTDSKWYKQWLKATKKNELKGGLTPNQELHKLPQVDLDDPPSHSIMYFSIGALRGTFAVRNISIVEVK